VTGSNLATKCTNDIEECILKIHIYIYVYIHIYVCMIVVIDMLYVLHRYRYILSLLRQGGMIAYEIEIKYILWTSISYYT